MPILMYMSKTEDQTWQSNVLRQDKCEQARLRRRHRVAPQPLVPFQGIIGTGSGRSGDDDAKVQPCIQHVASCSTCQ